MTGSTSQARTPTSRGALLQLAEIAGIQPAYTDMEGVTRKASRKTIQALLSLWGIPVDDEASISDALKEETLRHWRQCLEPVVVAWQGSLCRVEIRLPEGTDARHIQGTIHYEDGTCGSLDRNLLQMRPARRVRLPGGNFVAWQLSLPRVPLGYHELSLTHRHRNDRALIVSAPPKSYSRSSEGEHPNAQLAWAAFLPMYAVHSERSWGAGDLRDWQRLTDWVYRAGGRVVSTLPLLSAFLEKPVCEPSPYSPTSRLFWNEFFLDIEKIPEFHHCQAARRLVRSRQFQKQLQEFRKSKVIDYRQEASARRQVLEPLVRTFFSNNSSRYGEFQEFVRQRPLLQDYAAFRAACEQSGKSWHNWEQRLKHGKLERDDYAPAARQYHEFVQWQMEVQISDFIRHSRRQGLSFYLDLPLGVHPDGFDVWRHRDAFAFPASAGAPPDMFFTKGQDWGFAPLHPGRIRQRRFDYVIDYLRFQMGHADFLRIDHVMGLHRLYWIPRGFAPTEGAYVSYPAEELHAILSLESHRHQTVLVGENLGTVPPQVNSAMTRHNIRQIFVLQYEQQPDPARAVRQPPRLCVASVNTHDMPTFAAHWNATDLEDRLALGLISKSQLGFEKKKRVRLNSALAAFLKKKGFPPKPDNQEGVLRSCLEWLAASPAEIVQVNLEDLWAELAPQNTPGTSTERPNWRRKTHLSLEEIEDRAELRQFLRRLTRLRVSAGK